MVLPRPACLRSSLGQSTLRRASAQARTRTWRHVGRRTYASEHGAKKSSDLPWLIGSVVFTVPAATWLYGQGPTRTEHGHGHDEHAEKAEDAEEGEESGEGEAEDSGEEEKPAEGGDEEQADDSEEESKKDSKPESKEEDAKGDKPDDSDSEGSEGGEEKETPPTSDDESDEDKPSPDAPGQINKNDSKGPGELQPKGKRQKTETQGERNAQGSHSGAQNPYLEDDEKSKKGEGVKDTAKIHGTVDPSRPAR